MKPLYLFNIVGMLILILGVMLFAIMDMPYMAILTLGVAIIFTAMSWVFFE